MSTSLNPSLTVSAFFVKPENKEKLPLTQLLSNAQHTIGKDKIITRVEIANSTDRSVTVRSKRITRRLL